MNSIHASCPCCASSLLRHARHSGVYWFCLSCRQEMPDLGHNLAQTKRRNYQIVKLEQLIQQNFSRPALSL